MLYLFKQTFDTTRRLLSLKETSVQPFRIAKQEAPELGMHRQISQLFNTFIKPVQMQDQNMKQGKQGETFNLFLTQAIVWRLKIVLKSTHILNFILWNGNGLSIFSAYLRVAF